MQTVPKPEGGAYRIVSHGIGDSCIFGEYVCQYVLDAQQERVMGVALVIVDIRK